MCEGGQRLLEAGKWHLLCHDLIDLVGHLAGLYPGLNSRRCSIVAIDRIIGRVFDSRSDDGASFSVVSLRDFLDCEVVDSSAALQCMSGRKENKSSS